MSKSSMWAPKLPFFLKHTYAQTQNISQELAEVCAYVCVCTLPWGSLFRRFLCASGTAANWIITRTRSEQWRSERKEGRGKEYSLLGQTPVLCGHNESRRIKSEDRAFNDLLNLIEIRLYVSALRLNLFCQLTRCCSFLCFTSSVFLHQSGTASRKSCYSDGVWRCYWDRLWHAR